jgi:hypothetical protein
MNPVTKPLLQRIKLLSLKKSCETRVISARGPNAPWVLKGPRLVNKHAEGPCHRMPLGKKKKRRSLK